MRRLLFLIPCSLILCGCPKAAKYNRPQLPVPAAWPTEAAAEAVTSQAEGTEAAAAHDTPWQRFFADERLQGIVQMALENNRDLRIAGFTIEKAQAQYRIRSAERNPGVAVSIQGEGYRTPQSLAGGSNAKNVSQLRVGVGTASWELDFFGRINSLKSAALEQYFATQQARSAVQLSLVASIAGAYLDLAADRETLRLAEATVTTQQAYLDLVQQTRDLGIGSDLEVSQARTQVEAAKVDIARYRGYIAQDRNALNLLAGAPVPVRLLPDALDELPGFSDITAGLPSDVLLRRPDILMAEHQLKAYSANINAARANFFPRISLTAALGIASNDLGNLIKPAAGTWNFVPQFTLPIFDYGARKANYQAAELDRDIAVAGYERAIQAAFREVSDALNLRATLLEQQQAQEALVKSLEDTYRLSEARYKGGMDSYLSVLVAQRSLYAAQQQLVSTRLARLANQVVLYKVLGGGA